ncbi:MAG: GNAT family N-acetyltransferase [Nisaea sp.]|uniref:GNAT family N-acetyltransferase n=1 Tax=Nisaea sp. TaxID=2024842 RepID=UPI001B1E0C20|nr:GNAT family N-acetyltransferase [Nisaea sp.]MBO6562841.1 GNAT family N-acetyltransferase [Nisaea sp.]
MATCIPQPFDSGFIGAPVYRVEISSADQISSLRSLVPGDAALVSVRIPVSWGAPDPLSGFREIETLVSLERVLAEEDTRFQGAGIRFSTADDADACAAIAAAAFSADRYRADPLIADSIAARIKAAWARNEVTGRTDRTLIYEENGEILGFNGCLLRDGTMTVDLIAVASGHQGKGIGAKLLKAAFAHYAPRARKTLIATQASNHGALALYGKLGYVEIGRMRTFHFTPAPIGFA